MISRRPILTLVSALSVFILLCLGTWQVARLQWKNDLIARVNARMAETVPIDLPTLAVEDAQIQNVEYTLVAAQGFFVPGRTAYVFGTHEGEPGWFAFQPFQVLDGSGDYQYVTLVNLGFLADCEGAVPKTALPLPEGVAAIEGRLRRYSRAGPFTAPADVDHGAFYARDRDMLVQYFFGDTPDTSQVAPFYVDATSALDGTNAPTPGTTRVEFSNRHFGYALTWYGLAAGLVGVFIVMIRRPQES